MKFYPNVLIMAAFLCAAIIFAGCTTASNTASNTATANKANTASANTSTPASNTSNPANSSVKTETAPAGDPVGVAECDEYIKKYEACLTKIASKAPQAEGPLKTAFQAQRDGFKKAVPNYKSLVNSPVGTALQSIPDASTFYSAISGGFNPAVNVVPAPSTLNVPDVAKKPRSIVSAVTKSAPL